jgi:hypothetical protein
MPARILTTDPVGQVVMSIKFGELAGRQDRIDREGAQGCLIDWPAMMARRPANVQLSFRGSVDDIF